jgi:hypothetical protein
VVTVARASDSEYPVVLHRRPGRVTVTAALVTDVCVFITAVPITKLFAWGGGDSGGHVLRGTTSRVVCLLLQYRCVFFTAVPNTKLCAWGEEDSGGHVL